MFKGKVPPNFGLNAEHVAQFSRDSFRDIIRVNEDYDAKTFRGCMGQNSLVQSPRFIGQSSPIFRKCRPPYV